MKKIIIVGIVAILLIGLVIIRSRLAVKNVSIISNSPATTGQITDISSQPQNSQTPVNTTRNNQTDPVAPISRAGERVTKKPFGIFITPANSPVQPERFFGYHTGTDFETFPEEHNIDVPIYAITSGKILVKESASGYGGVLVESATINNQPVTIIYGHLNLASINKKAGDNLDAGEKIGVLGKGYSSETDGERKHLHLGIHKGSGINIRGYVNNKSELSGWIDAMTILSSNS